MIRVFDVLTKQSKVATIGSLIEWGGGGGKKRGRWKFQEFLMKVGFEIKGEGELGLRIKQNTWQR